MDLLARIKELCSDPTLWDLWQVQNAIGVKDRTVMYKFMYTGDNYDRGGVTTWPPTMAEMSKRDLGEVPVDLASDCPPHVSILRRGVSLSGGRRRWRAGDVRRWAMQVGRMTMHGTPIVPTSARGSVAKPKAVSGDPVDLGGIDALIEDPTPWGQREIAELFEVDVSAVDRWARATRNRTTRGVRMWPPLSTETKHASTGGRGPRLRGWPPHHRLLPPEPEWTAGNIRLWGLRTGRLRLDGTVVTIKSGS